jgi:hypothetical protein
MCRIIRELLSAVAFEFLREPVGVHAAARDLFFDPCRLARQVKEFGGYMRRCLAAELLHLPGQPAGVELAQRSRCLAAELLHLPGEPAGVEHDDV